MPSAVIESARWVPKARLRIGDNIWAVADQMLISGTNFVTMILLARGLGSASDFGVFVLVYSILLFCNSVQSALVTQPHNVLGAARKSEEYVRYTSSSLFNQLALVLALGILVFAAWAVCRWIGWQGAPLLLALSTTVIAWQLQEFLRRVLYTERRTAVAFAIDLLAYGGQTLAISFLWWNDRLSGSAAFYAISLASMIAAAVGWWKLRFSLALQYDFEVTKENWQFGKWLAASYLVGNWLSSQLLIFLAAGILGTWAAGVLRAMHTIFGPLRILAQAFSLTLPTKLANTLENEGWLGFHRETRLAFLTATPLFGFYCLLVVILSGHILTFSFGKSYEGFEGVLILHAISAFISYLSIIFAAVLRATRHTRQIFRCELTATLAIVPLTACLIPILGIYGVVLGMIFTDLLLVALFSWTYRETLAAMDAKSSTPPATSQVVDRTDGDADARQQPTSQSIPSTSAGQRGHMLAEVFEALDRKQIPYCVLHGYEHYPDEVRSDVDCVMPASALAGTAGTNSLSQVLAELSAGHDLTPVQWFRGGAHGIVLHKPLGASGSEFLPLDVSDGCHLNQRVLFYSDQEILQTRRRFKQFWIPATKIEFGCYLIRRITKLHLSPQHAHWLSTLYQQDPAGCRQQISRLLGKRSGERVVRAATSGDWSDVQAQLRPLRFELILKAAFKHPGYVIAHLASGAVRRVRRWFTPSGFHLVLLGPDGAGKSSVAAQVQQSLAPAFLGTLCRSFPPRLLNRPVGDPSQPHNIQPRSPLASVIRAVLYWWTYYSPGYYFTVYPALVHGSFVIHDRHVIDCVVDPIRYRYAGPAWLLRAIWRWLPKPQLVVLLDVPAEILQTRKQEVAFEVSAQQRKAYRDLVEQLPNGTIVDGSQSLERVVADVNRLILRTMTDRLKHRSQRYLHT